MSDPTRARAALSLRARTALTLCLGLIWAAPVAAHAPAAAKPAKHAHKGQKAKPNAQASDTVQQLAQWVIASNDHSDLPFVIIDKVAARVFVFGADGKLRGTGPALLGLAKGDTSSPGVGDREVANIPKNERTTPAGRFVASFGSASGGAKVLWVDYTTAISMHPVVTNHPEEHRLERLASPTPKDNRITHGCINVSAAFYDKVVRPTFTGTSGIVYILPEKMPFQEVFPAFRLVADAAPAPDARKAEAPTGEARSAGDLH
jgi:hypothetical protein